jgi:tRNA(Arg) A34 adenosine deaminase TadA
MNMRQSADQDEGRWMSEGSNGQVEAEKGAERESVRSMRRAIELASENVRLGAGGPFGAVITREGVVLAEGANMVTATNDPTAHAEVVAIRRACAALQTFDLSGSTIYCSCEPCPMCLSAIYWARIETIYHGCNAEDAAAAGFDDARLYQEFATERAGRAIPCLPLLREEAGASFAAWMASPARVEY